MKSSYSDIEENSPLDKIYIPGQLAFYSESDLVRMTGWSKRQYRGYLMILSFQRYSMGKEDS